ncbi:potassium-transporting ATPase subunit KdpA [Bacillus sp. CBEL-1]|uniref:potassium-transporting ATPase subunit KdpA n=1 Tax=Bacillus sp. CBEL-1 TaxID=2502980 RepID=UPI001052DCE2|nr:potassium-transporting ATPase subunit KdpA [Bacillus sp. CBEL-1]TDB49971.1 potassium-transporting ATPase subunit A [Bacillus sp. CBEL-1]
MNTILFTIVLLLLLVAAVAKPVGVYVAKVFSEEPTAAAWMFMPIDRLLYKAIGIQPKDQTWKEYAISLLLVNTFMILVVYTVFRTQAWLPLNPSAIGNMAPDLAFNTAISFMTNTNLQHYSGESGLSYFSQMIAILFMMFAAPASALSVAIAFMRGMTGKSIGNFFTDFIKSITHVLLPVAVVAGIIFVLLGVPQTLDPTVTATTLEGEKQEIARGPVAAFLSIKEFGNNGGGFFGVNSAHPFENPNGLSNMLQIVLMLLLPVSLPFTYSRMIGNKREGRMLFASMSLLFVVFLSIALISEQQGNPAFNDFTLNSENGYLEGKEVRFGVEMSTLYAIVTTASETGAVNTMHDTLTPISGMLALSNMLLNTVYGGVGAGFINVMMYVLIAVFLSGLMVGRTPEYVGKKIEGKEMKLIAVTLILQPLLILGFTAVALTTKLGLDGISNPGFHGLTQVLYEYTSSAANNGSGFEGLGDATVFWNISTGLVMYIGRLFGLITLLAVASSLSQKQLVPQTSGTFKTDTPLFGGILIGTMFVVGALTFFPVLVLGPVAEFLTL